MKKIKAQIIKDPTPPTPDLPPLSTRKKYVKKFRMDGVKVAGYKFTEERVNLILNELAKGEPIYRMCKTAGIDYHTFDDWYKNKPEFKEACDEIFYVNIETEKNEALEAIKKSYKSGTWTAAAWILERKYPEQFALRQNNKLELSGSVEHKQIIINVLDVETRELMAQTANMLSIKEKSKELGPVNDPDIENNTENEENL